MKKSLFGLLATPISIIIFFVSILIGHWFSEYIEANAIAFLIYALMVAISALGSYLYVCTR